MQLCCLFLQLPLSLFLLCLSHSAQSCGLEETEVPGAPRSSADALGQGIAGCMLVWAKMATGAAAGAAALLAVVAIGAKSRLSAADLGPRTKA